MVPAPNLRRALPLLFVLLLAVPALAQETPAAGPKKPPTEEEATEQLQNAVQNPVASLISVPLQNNTNFNIGPYDRTQDVLNIEPVIPFNVSKNWVVIARIIQPIVWQPYPSATTGGEFGLGDMNPSFFLSPRKAGKLIWGVGPAIVIPTATNDNLGQGYLSHVAHHHRQLEGQQRKRADAADDGHRPQNHEARIPAGKHSGGVLRQCDLPRWRLAVGYAIADSLPVS